MRSCCRIGGSRFSYARGDARTHTFKEIVSEEGLPCANPDGAVVVIGPYEEKTEAVEVLKQIRVSHFIFGELSYKD